MFRLLPSCAPTHREEKVRRLVELTQLALYISSLVGVSACQAELREQNNIHIRNNLEPHHLQCTETGTILLFLI